MSIPASIIKEVVPERKFSENCILSLLIWTPIPKITNLILLSLDTDLVKKVSNFFSVNQHIIGPFQKR